jgi:hypothetical protein
MKERRREVIDRLSNKVRVWYQYLLILLVLVVMIMKERRGEERWSIGLQTRYGYGID